MLRGFFIFLVFICKPKIWDLVQKRHPKLRSCFSICNTCQDQNHQNHRGSHENVSRTTRLMSGGEICEAIEMSGHDQSAGQEEIEANEQV